jgi:hypothetical protein
VKNSAEADAAQKDYWMLKLMGFFRNKMKNTMDNQIMAKPMRSVHKTWADLSSDEIFHRFINGLLEILQKKIVGARGRWS